MFWIVRPDSYATNSYATDSCSQLFTVSWTWWHCIQQSFGVKFIQIHLDTPAVWKQTGIHPKTLPFYCATKTTISKKRHTFCCSEHPHRMKKWWNMYQLPARLPSKTHMKRRKSLSLQAIATRAAVGNGWPWMSWAKTNFSWSVRWGLVGLFQVTVGLDWLKVLIIWGNVSKNKTGMAGWLTQPTMSCWSEKDLLIWWNKPPNWQTSSFKWSSCTYIHATLPSQSFTYLKKPWFPKGFSFFQGAGSTLNFGEVY